MPAGGLSDQEYTNWLNNTAADDCNLPTEVAVRYIEGGSDLYTTTQDICDFMQDSDESVISTLSGVEFHGMDGGQPWSGIDERQGENIERVANEGNVPDKIKRPGGS